jgi:hypothetical protein
LTAGCALIVISNALTLGAAAWNRWGGPRNTLELTDRELALPLFREPEDTGIELSLVSSDETPRAVSVTSWLKGKRIGRIEHTWLDPAKLRELGFNVDVGPSDPDAGKHYDLTLPRYAYVVLEFDGPAFAGWIGDRERQVDSVRRDVEQGLKGREELTDAEALLALDRLTRSRLFPVDAGLDAAELLRRHPDRQRYLILRGIVAPELFRDEGQPPVLRGRISQLLAQRVHAPLKFHPQLAPILPKLSEEKFYEQRRKEKKTEWPVAAPPRFRATIAVGRRLEPWLVSVAVGAPAQTPASTNN